MKTDVPPTPKVTTTCRITKTCECLDCGEMTAAKTGMVNGTSLGPNLLTEASALWEKNTKDIADFLKDKYGEKFSAATIQHALDAVAVGLEPDAQKLRYDETSYTIMGKNGWAWVHGGMCICHTLWTWRIRGTSLLQTQPIEV